MVVVCVQRTCMMSVTSVRVCESRPCLGKVCVFVCTCAYLCPGQNGHMLMEYVFGMSSGWCLCPHIPHLSLYLESSGSGVSGVSLLCVLGGSTHVCSELWRLLSWGFIRGWEGVRIYIWKEGLVKALIAGERMGSSGGYGMCKGRGGCAGDIGVLGAWVHEALG